MMLERSDVLPQSISNVNEMDVVVNSHILYILPKNGPKLKLQFDLRDLDINVTNCIYVTVNV